jgi:hypothetical protein
VASWVENGVAASASDLRVLMDDAREERSPAGEAAPPESPDEDDAAAYPVAHFGFES